MKKTLSAARIILILYEFTRIIFVYPDGDYLTVIHAIFAGFGILSLACCIKENPKKALLSWQGLFTFIILLWTIAVTYIMAGRVDYMLQVWLLQVAWFTLFLRIPDTLYTRKEIKKEIRLVMLIVFLCTLVGTILSFASLYHVKTYEEPLFTKLIDGNPLSGANGVERFEGVFRHPTIMGLMNVLAIVSSFYLWKRFRLKPLLVLNIAMQGYSLIKTNSRSPMIAFSLVALCTVLYFATKKRSMGMQILYLIAAVAIIAVAVAGTLYIFKNRLVPLSLDETAYQNYLKWQQWDPDAEYVLTQKEFVIDQISSSRYRMWKIAILLGMRWPHPLTGWGIGEYKSAIESVYGPELTNVVVGVVHSVFVESFFDAGFPGLISLISLMFLQIKYAVRSIKKCREHNEMFFVLMVMIAVLGFCSFDMGIWFRKFFYSGLFWLTGGYFSWLARSFRKKKPGKPASENN